MAARRMAAPLPSPPHRRLMSPGRSRRGFTLIEMIVVVLIVGILASAAMPLAALHKRRTQEVQLRENLRVLRKALDDYKRYWDRGLIERTEGASGYPPNLRVLEDGINDISRPDNRRIYILRRLPRDPFADPSLPAEATWGLRSYESPPESPTPGKDVFNVYSQAEGVGLDGVPYRQW